MKRTCKHRTSVITDDIVICCSTASDPNLPAMVRSRGDTGAARLVLTRRPQSPASQMAWPQRLGTAGQCRAETPPPGFLTHSLGLGAISWAMPRPRSFRGLGDPCFKGPEVSKQAKASLSSGEEYGDGGTGKLTAHCHQPSPEASPRMG